MAKAKATRTITLTDDQREYLQLFITLDKESAIAIEIGVSILTVKKTFHNLGKDIETVVKRQHRENGPRETKIAGDFVATWDVVLNNVLGKAYDSRRRVLCL